jgi:hypothetical protein
MQQRQSLGAAEERNRATECRQQMTHLTRIKAGKFVAQCRCLLSDAARNRLQMSEVLVVLIEGLRLRWA